MSAVQEEELSRLEKSLSALDAHVEPCSHEHKGKPVYIRQLT